MNKLSSHAHKRNSSENHPNMLKQNCKQDADPSPPSRMDKMDMWRWRPAYHQAGHKETQSPITRGEIKEHKKLPTKENADKQDNVG